MKVHVITVSPFGQAPSQRFRHEQYLEIFEKEGIFLVTRSFFSPQAFGILYQEGKLFAKFVGVLAGFIRRVIDLYKVSSADIVFIHREAIPIGPPVFEWLVAKVWRKKIIYDFDDAVWLLQKEDESKLKTFLKNPLKVDHIIRWSWKVSCGNEYLAQHARLFNNRVVVNPTTVDTNKRYHLVKKHEEKKVPVIGWTGSHSTLMYLEMLLPLLDRLYAQQPFELLIICNRSPAYMPHYATFRVWKEDTEIEDLLNMDIGIMPLPDKEWTKGKCGFKAIQYMALGIPSVVSKVGANSAIVDHAENGFLCETESDWSAYTLALLKDAKLRTGMGKKAREKIIEHYSVSSNQRNFVSLFRD